MWLTFPEFRNKRKTYLIETRVECRKAYHCYTQHKKDQEKVNSLPATVCVTYAEGTNGYFAPLPEVKCQPTTVGFFPIKKAVDKQQEGNSPMSYSANAAYASITAPATEIQDQRKYLTKRLDEVYRDKRDPLEAAFGLIDDATPTTPADLAARIADGKFIIRGTGEDKTDVRYFYWTDMFQWRDPAKKADTDGFKAARDALKAAKQAALDTIKIDEPKAGLEAIKALESWTPTGAAN